MINYQKSCVPSVCHKWNRLSNFVNHAWMLKRCWRVVWTHRNCAMAKRFELVFVWFLFGFWFAGFQKNGATCFEANVLKFSRFISRMCRERNHHRPHHNWSRRYRTQRRPRQWWKLAYRSPLARRRWPKLQYKKIPLHQISWVVLFKQSAFRWDARSSEVFMKRD